MAERSHRWLLSAILKQCLSTGLLQRGNLAPGAAARVARGAGGLAGSLSSAFEWYGHLQSQGRSFMSYIWD